MATAQAQEAKVITSKNNKGNRATKIALFSLAVVFLIIISEAVYLIFGKNGVPFLNLGKQNQQEEGERSLIDSPFIPSASSIQDQQSGDISVNSKAAHVLADQLDFLAKEGHLDQSDVSFTYFEYTGTVVDAGMGELVVDGRRYTYYILIKKPDGSQVTYRLSDEEMASAKIILYTLPESQEISIENIKPGDTIIIKETTNLLNASSPPGLLLEIRRKR